jgi:hypothetical protein
MRATGSAIEPLSFGQYWAISGVQRQVGTVEGCYPAAVYSSTDDSLPRRSAPMAYAPNGHERHCQIDSDVAFPALLDQGDVLVRRVERLDRGFRPADWTSVLLRAVVYQHRFGDPIEVPLWGSRAQDLE